MRSVGSCMSASDWSIFVVAFSQFAENSNSERVSHARRQRQRC